MSSALHLTGTSSSTEENPQTRAGFEFYGLLIAGFAILLLLSLVSYPGQNLIGPVGEHMARLLLGAFGTNAIFICCTFFYFAGLLLAGRRFGISGAGLSAYLAILICVCVLLHLFFKDGYRPFGHMAGGAVGHWVGEISRSMFATTGTILISLSVLLASILKLSGMSIRKLARQPYELWLQYRGVAIDGEAQDQADGQSKTRTTTRVGKRQSLGEDAIEPDIVEHTGGSATYDDIGAEEAFDIVDDDMVEDAEAEKASAVYDAVPVEEEESTQTPRKQRKKRNKAPELTIEEHKPCLAPAMVADQKALKFTSGPLPFEFPSMSFLDYEEQEYQAVDKERLKLEAEKLEEKLRDFKVDGKVVLIQTGPVVTMFEYQPAPGIKISKIANLADDIAMALEAVSVRIVAPIPGKGVVGIEIPSEVRETVFLKQILSDKVFQESRAKLPIALGKDIVGKAVVTDLANAPHLLVAGATGMGKSVAINAFIISLLYRMKPRDLRLILVDPKMLELSVYDNIPHLLLPVVTEPKKASLALKWAVAEMNRRYQLLSAFNVRSLDKFNEKIVDFQEGKKQPPEGVAADELEHLPYIVIVLDELADLMMVAKKDVESSIARLAQMARAAGIHLVIATQRPSVDVITGLIKANMPTRISLKVAQKVDSRTILDANGAEYLIGKGDMLFQGTGANGLIRVQGCFVSDEEVERVTDHLRKFGPPDYDMSILLDDDNENKKDLSDEEYDTLFDDAVAIVTNTRNPSISYLQRRLKIGYNRSARIIERMEFDGIISTPDHRGSRKVLAQEAPDFD
jgi:DNA segregation ATPase FtsK/SpoIIIE-like protein